jgi:splicing factor 3B subunit 4
MTTRITPGVGANLLGQHAAERNQDATAYVGNLDSQVSEELLWELFVQAGPVVNVYVPKDRVTNLHQGYGFVEFRSEEDADYAIKILNMIKLYGKPIRVNKASQDKKVLDVGANLFVGNLDPDVDEKLLYDTFSAFGVIVTNPKIMRDPDSGNSRGFGFISYDSFESSDASIEAMNGQYLCNRPITVSYAYKKDTKGERHGTHAERLLASNNPNATKNRPHTLFASGPPQLVGPPQLGQGLPPPPVQANGGMSMNGPMHHPPPVYNGGPPPMPPPPQGQMMQGHPPPPQGYGGPPMQPQQGGPPPPWGNQGQGMPPPPQFRGGPPGSHMPPPPHGFQGGPPGGAMGMGGPPPPWGRGPPPQGIRPPPPGMQQQGQQPPQQQQGPPPPRGPPGMPPPPPPGGMMGGPGGRPPPPPG